MFGNYVSHYLFLGYSGREVDLIALFNELEQHITGDIAFALQLYWQLTKDLNWLSTRGYPIASEIAKFWASRVTRNTFGLYEIHRVVGPDEFGIGFPWYSGVDNNVFTNVVAQISLRFANKAARALQKQVVPLYDTIANNMTILFDEVNQIHPEYDGFPKGNIYFFEYVKQADVVLLGMFLCDFFENDSDHKNSPFSKIHVIYLHVHVYNHSCDLLMLHDGKHHEKTHDRLSSHVRNATSCQVQ